MLKYTIAIILLAFLYIIIFSLAKASSRQTPDENTNGIHSTTNSIDK